MAFFTRGPFACLSSMQVIGRLSSHHAGQWRYVRHHELYEMRQHLWRLISATNLTVPHSLLGIARGKTSTSWRYCRVEDGKLLPSAWVDASGTKWWHCQPCFDKKRDKRYNYSGGSSSIIHHLRREHNIVISGKEQARRGRTENYLGDITAFLAQEDMQPNNKRKYTPDAESLDQATVRELYCRFTVACSLPFFRIEQPAFRHLIRYISPAADNMLPRSGSTVKDDLQGSYEKKKEIVKMALQSTVSSIHIVPDNWTSPNGHGVIGLTGQSVSEEHGLQSLVEKIQELDGQHSGENMAEVVMRFIRECGIAQKVGYFMMDNASNMNTMIDRVSDDLEHEFGVFYDPLPHRLRCVGHIINLAVMEFLVGQRPLTNELYDPLASASMVEEGCSMKRKNGYKMWMKEQKSTILNKDDDEYDVYCREPAGGNGGGSSSIVARCGSEETFS